MTDTKDYKMYFILYQMLLYFTIFFILRSRLVLLFFIVFNPFFVYFRWILDYKLLYFTVNNVITTKNAESLCPLLYSKCRVSQFFFFLAFLHQQISRSWLYRHCHQQGSCVKIFPQQITAQSDLLICALSVTKTE